MRSAVLTDKSKIKAAAEAIGDHCTQEWLAEKSGCTLSVVQKAYQGKSIERKNLEKIARALGVEAQSLIKSVHAYDDGLLDAIPLPIFIKDTDGIYRGCNEKFCTYLGRHRDQIIGKTVFEVALPRNAKVYEEKDKRLLAGPRREQIYRTYVEGDREKRDVVFFKGVLRREQEGRVIIGVIVDFSYCSELPVETLQGSER